MKCPYCDNGVVHRLLNSADFHFNGDCPIEEDEPCEECGGIGFTEGAKNTEQLLQPD